MTDLPDRISDPNAPADWPAVLDAVQHLGHVFDEHLESILHSPSPRFPLYTHQVLLVVADACTDLSRVLTEANRRFPPGVNTICVRASELFEVCLPDPAVPDAFSASSWFKHEGRVLWGGDPRPLIPGYRHTHRLLAFHLEATVHRTRNHVILARLTADRYSDLIHDLSSTRRSIMTTALVARRIWRVHADSLVDEFLRRYPDRELADNAAEFEALRASHAAASSTDLRRMGHRAAWLFESFVRALWRHAS
jgi:hypothetical protein